MFRFFNKLTACQYKNQYTNTKINILLKENKKIQTLKNVNIHNEKYLIKNY